VARTVATFSDGARCADDLWVSVGQGATRRASVKVLQRLTARVAYRT